MWGVDDEIRQLIKNARASLSTGENAGEAIETLTDRINEMISKEENILFPMMMETLSADEWKKIADDGAEYGYCLIGEVQKWAPDKQQAEAKPDKADQSGLVFPTGTMKPEEIACLLDSLPFDITFVDKDDTVKYFSQGKDRIFARAKAIIGRKVSNCHPPASVYIVEKIVSDFKSGVKDHEEFWIRMGEKFVFIRYFAVRSEAGEYLGTVEVTQDIAPIQAIKDEKRLLSE